MVFRIIKRSALLLLLFSAPFMARALDLSDVYGSVSDIFSPLIDRNEGTTVFRSLLIPPGGRAEAMGSAFTALANDISFFDYNPAASSTLKNTELALFHNAWIADSAMETLAFTRRYNNLGYGAALKCFYVPFTEYNIFGERVSRGYYTETTGILNVSYNFFAGYYFKGIATGVNLKMAWRGMPDYSDDNGNIVPGSGLSQSAFAVMGDAGIQFRFNILKFYQSREPNFCVGLGVNNMGVSLTGFGTEKVVRDDSLPAHIGGGISWQPIQPLTVTLEVRQPVNLNDITLSERLYFGVGTNIQFTDFFAFQAGFLLKGANPRISLGGEILFQAVQFNINYTLDLTSSLNPFNRVSVSAKFNFGDDGRKKQQEEIDRLYREGLQYYSMGELSKAVDSWERVLEMNRYFEPAEEGRQAALYSLSLQQKIQELQTLD